MSIDSEHAVTSAVTQQPVSIAFEANQSLFQSYSSGVLNASFGTKLDHSVLAVGYGTDAGSENRKEKKSWEVRGGEQGCIRFQRGESGCCVGWKTKAAWCCWTVHRSVVAFRQWPIVVGRLSANHCWSRGGVSTGETTFSILRPPDLCLTLVFSLQHICPLSQC